MLPLEMTDLSFSEFVLATEEDVKNLACKNLSVTRVVLRVSRAFCSTDQEKRETARSLLKHNRFNVVVGTMTGNCG